MGFMGWWAERDSAGRWFAYKVSERQGFGPVGLVRYRHHLDRLRRGATKFDAEREIRRLYQLRVLS